MNYEKTKEEIILLHKTLNQITDMSSVVCFFDDPSFFEKPRSLLQCGIALNKITSEILESTSLTDKEKNVVRKLVPRLQGRIVKYLEKFDKKDSITSSHL